MTDCRGTGCDQPAIALIAAPLGPPDAPVFAIVRPITTLVRLGEPLCLDCTHTAVDLMLMRAQEATS